MSKVSIIMPVYNGERFIKQAIESVLAQSYSNWELIVVNDGSTDRTADIVSRYADSRIKLVHQDNFGEASARNTALKNMQGEYLAFLDADDLYLPHHLEYIMQYFSTHEQVDAVYTDGYYINQGGKQIKTLSSCRRGPFEGDIFEKVVRSSDVFGGAICVVLHRRLVDQLGLEYDPEIVIGPDWDFLTRFSESANFGYVDYPTCCYRIHQSNISTRTNSQHRAFGLAKCREIAIKLGRFNACSEETRAFVFYDLLVNLLAGLPERQAAVIQWPEFDALPKHQRARLFRLMASKALLREEPIKYVQGGDYVQEWLSRSLALAPENKRGVLLNALYKFNPWICKSLLKLRASKQPEPLNTSPFSNLF